MAKGDKIKGGLADKVSVEDIAKKHKVSVKDIEAQIKMGRKVEMEHVDDDKLAEEIALDHLYEIPDYYTRLDKMEKEAKKENITEFARRMRELAGLSENNQKKSIHTIQEGFSSHIDKDGDRVYDLPIDVNSIEELIALADSDEELDSFLKTELYSDEGVKVKNGNIFWGSDIFDHLKSEPRQSIANSINEQNKGLPGEKDENGMPIPAVCPGLMGFKINESEESEFETHKFEQKTIEEGEEDVELYSLNENTIIVLDFLDEDEEK